jgi:hypothetical protein
MALYATKPNPIRRKENDQTSLFIMFIIKGQIMKRSRKILLSSLLLCGVSLQAEMAYEMEWVSQFGTSGSEYGDFIATDSSGSLYVCGYTTGVFAGQTGSGPLDLDAYIAKYDSDGNQIWIKQFITPNVGKSIAIDSGGNLYMTGVTSSTFPGETSSGGADTYIVKYDSGGNQIWAKQFGTSDYDSGYSVTIDSGGDLYVTGETRGTFAGQMSSGNADTFIAKYDSSGNQIWIKQFGTSEYDRGDAITADTDDNLYVTGMTLDTFPGESSSGSGDTYIAKYDNEGNQIWIKQFGTSDDDDGTSVTTDSGGNIYLTGFTDGTFAGQTSNGSRDAYIAKFDSDGNQIWTKQFGTSDFDNGSSITTDINDHLYVGGHTYGTFSGQSSSGSSDVYIAKYDSDGNQAWAKQFGTSDNDSASGLSITADESENLYVTGTTMGEFEGETNSGGHDVFIAEFLSVNTAVMQTVNEIIDTINSLPTESFKNSNLKKALTNKLNAVLKMIADEEYENALTKLTNDILPKTDGCALRGEPDKQDWIITCEEQEPIYNLILETVSRLETIIAL